jgi:hypothetical protein
MFADRRFGTNGNIPHGKRLPKVTLSNDRSLYIRLSSPHESNINPAQFHKGIIDATGSGRWCFAGAFHTHEFNKMPDFVESIKLFKSKFNPERVRVCLLSPNKRGKTLCNDDIQYICQQLQRLRGIEYMFIDAQDKYINGLLLADFFDFA